MKPSTLPAATMIGAVLFALACVALAGLWFAGASLGLIALAAAAGWAAALAALRPLTPSDQRTAFYFAFAIMGFLIFFLYETYQLKGGVRAFPLIVGWAGLALAALDILRLTDTGPGRVVSGFFDVALAPPQEGRALSREFIVIAALGCGVLLFWLFGFLIASPLFVFLWMLVWGGKSVRHSIYGGAATLAFIWLLFEVALSYELYRGVMIDRIVEAMRG